MTDRDTFLKEFRGETLGTISAQSSPDEIFQNQTIRPILKLQNDLFIAVFINYINKNKADFYSYTVEKKLQTVENSIQKDIKFRNSLKGIVMALFTVEEYETYIKNSSDLNKRMMNLLIDRLKNQVQLFEVETNN
ncbi:glyoxalase [Flavobacterium hibisci]|uniref:glyoxalase n=1 Tax=Flavobacterium hibisci TaxID=1914462 RepID=UPI001CC1AAF8|nr:glyoxalase [Flavobacterium hibisci]MBZ4042316.1 glyoxalase [Flavobacterium hibisci]